MNKRDLIIVTVLVNAGLMTIFFISALKSDNSNDEAVATNAPLSASFPEVKMREPHDEIDQVLKEHSQSSLAPAVAMTPPLQTPAFDNMPMSSPLTASGTSTGTAASAVAVPNFADDLKAIALPDPSISSAPAHAPVAAKATEVTVQKGDVLEKIARNNGVSVDEIMKANQLTSTRLKIGQVLKIPGKSGAKAAGAPAKSAESGSQYYTVKNGDNPWTIAVKNRLKVEELLKLNDLDEEKARRLKPGDKLRIK